MGLKSLFKKFMNTEKLPELQDTAKKGKLPDWKNLRREDADFWNQRYKDAESGDEILIPTCVGGQAAVTILESTLGMALTLRGAKVRLLLCDKKVPACLNVHFKKIGGYHSLNSYEMDGKVCRGCFAKGDAVFKQTGLDVLYYSDFISDDEIEELRELIKGYSVEEIRAYQKDGLAIGEHAHAGALRFLSMGQLPASEEAETVLKRYFESALITEKVFQRIFDQNRYKAAVFNHGIYVPHGIIGEVCRQRDVRVANWQVAYRQKCFIFSHYETYHHALIKEPVSNWENMKLSDNAMKTIMDYLNSRRYGTKDWIWFHDQPKHELEDIKKELDVDFSKPVISLLTNVFWDAQLHYKANAFEDMLDWLIKTIEYFRTREDLQLVIRIHPAEVRGAIPSRQPLTGEIEKAFPVLPENVFVIPPESQVSTYTLSENSNAVLIYGTKTGVELTSIGIPVVVGGEAWIRNKGLTRDADSPEEYYSILDELPFENRMDSSSVERARKYAFHFFYRRFIPLEFMNPCSAGVPYEVGIESLKELDRGADKGLDVLCDGIIKGEEFIYPAEEYL